MKQILWTLVIGMMFGTACSAKQEKELKPTFINIHFTVDDSVYTTNDYSNFNVLVYNRQNAAAAADTIFFGITDTTGRINGSFKLEQEGAYPLQVSRNGINITTLRVILSEDDTVNISGTFPNFEETYSIDSRESRAMAVYDRVERGFQLTNRYILAGQVPDTLITFELQKWVDLYWEVFEERKGTIASKFALEGMINLLDRYDKVQMFEKLNQSFDEDLAFGLAITKGKDFLADVKGLDETLSYMDSLKTLTKQDDIIQAIDQSIIKINFDSARVEEADRLLQRYDSKYNEKGVEPSFWYKNLRYEISYLAPGLDIPEFSFITSDGDTISNSSMIGKPYVLEFTPMADQMYQSQYEEATVIYQIYNRSGLEYITIPFDQSVNTIIAFFQERDRYWELADPPSFNKQELIEDFNIQYFPTRILVNKEGKIVRKFVGVEFDEIIPAITSTLKNN